MPQFKRETLDGKAVDTATFGGHEVVVKFFAEYCEPCKRTLPAAEEIHRSHPEVAFLGVSEDESGDVAQRVVAQYQLTFPVVVDRSHILAGRFRVTDMPVTFVADSRATIRWVGDERQTPQDIGRAVDAYR
jgi:peroxiredoxin